MLTGDVGKFGTLPVVIAPAEEKSWSRPVNQTAANGNGKIVKKPAVVTETKQTSINPTVAPETGSGRSSPKPAASAALKPSVKVAQQPATAATN